MNADDPNDTNDEPAPTADSPEAPDTVDPRDDAPEDMSEEPDTNPDESDAVDDLPEAPGEAAEEDDLSEAPGEAAEEDDLTEAPGGATSTDDLSEAPGEPTAADDLSEAPADPAVADDDRSSDDAEKTSAAPDAPTSSWGRGEAAEPAGDDDLVDDDLGDDPLAAALAELDAPRRPAPAGVTLSEELPIDPEDDLRGVEGEASPRLVSILESLLFAAARPLKVQDLRKVLAETSKHQIQLALAHLMAVTRDRGVMLSQVAGGFQFRTHPDNAVWVQKMLQSKPARLSRTQIETLAIVAYRQPITRPEVDDVRGVDSGAVLKGLLERELVQIVGKKEEPGRPLLYGTTVKFLEFFNLRGLRDLPTLRDFRDLSEESKATLRTQLGASEAEALGQGVLGFPSVAAEGPTDMPPSEQDPMPTELPSQPSPDELYPPAPETAPEPGPDEIRPPDPGTDSPSQPDEVGPPSPDIADIPGTDPDIGGSSEVGGSSDGGGLSEV